MNVKYNEATLFKELRHYMCDVRLQLMIIFIVS